MTTRIRNFFRTLDGEEFREKLSRYAAHHPYPAFAMIFLAMPLAILMTVCLVTGAVAVPMGVLMGCL